MAPPDEQPVSTEEDEVGRLEMERLWQLRQENILPLERAWNLGRFYGLVLKGSQSFTCFQRVGIFMIGFLAIGVALTFLFGGWPFSKFEFPLKYVYQRLSEVSLGGMVAFLLRFLLGVRFCWVALRPQRHNRVE